MLNIGNTLGQDRTGYSKLKLDTNKLEEKFLEQDESDTDPQGAVHSWLKRASTSCDQKYCLSNFWKTFKCTCIKNAPEC